MNNVINLAAVRAARQGAAQAVPQQATPTPTPKPPPPVRPIAKSAPPAPFRWRESARGNWWTQSAGGLHLVLYETTQGWRGRATTPRGQGWYVDVPPGGGTLAAAQAWAEGWLGMQSIAEAAETRV
jgi:hypothetical protein